jgi:tetratricopeptide (TPR) repeat protein
MRLRSGADREDALFTPDHLGLEEPAKYIDTELRFRRIAAESSITNDAPAVGKALLWVAWAVEKQGRGIEALEHAARAQTLLRESDDRRLLAECCHSLGVWRFHHVDAEPPVKEFSEAIELRVAVGDVMGAAQSWHNLGYVQLISGLATDAISSYERAAGLLAQAQTGADSELATTAFRQFGFVLSHQAYAAARHLTVNEALRSAKTYFEHVAASG